jgi:hypothetical protein
MPRSVFVCRNSAAACAAFGPDFGCLTRAIEGKQQPFSFADERVVRPFLDVARRIPDAPVKIHMQCAAAMNFGDAQGARASNACPPWRYCHAKKAQQGLDDSCGIADSNYAARARPKMKYSSRLWRRKALPHGHFQVLTCALSLSCY